MNSLQILVVEDNIDDLFLIQRILSKFKLDDIVIMENGERALEYLYRRARISRKLLPGLIISDINMPLMNGVELLKIIRHIEYTRDIPVVVLSSSIQEKDMQVCRELGVIEYLRKPMTVKNIVDILLRLGHVCPPADVSQPYQTAFLKYAGVDGW